MKPSTAQQHSPGRRHVVSAVVLLVAGLLAWRAFALVSTHGDFLQGQGDARYLRDVPVPAHRGMITDRLGEPLAVSTPVVSVWADPRDLSQGRDRWPQLAKALDIPVKRLESLSRQAASRRFVYLKRHLEPEVARRALALKLPGVQSMQEYRRYYPTGEVSAHVVGFTNVDDHGQEGMELAYDTWLQGHAGAKRVIRDRYGRVVEDVEGIREARPGQDLNLSLDRRVQYLAYRTLKAAVRRNRARAGTVVMLDVNTGEVLAMVNQPAYNPNNRSDRVSDRVRNRAVTDVFEPGSTIKPFTVLAALGTGRFQPATLLDTAPGRLKVGRLTVKDFSNYGTIDVATVIKKSSNVGASKLALAIEPEDLWQTFARVGLGLATGSGFPGESSGSLSEFFGWGEVHRATLSYGYGLAVTGLQLARAYSAIGADGVLPPVSFQRVDQPQAGERVLSAEDARRVRRMLESVVDSEGGTGRRARVPGYRVAGKTGTVHKNGVGGYDENRYLAVFAGMAPASDPRFAMVVLIDEPGSKDYFGGQVAAPVFSDIMAGTLRLMGVPPDDARILAASPAGAREGVL